MTNKLIFVPLAEKKKLLLLDELIVLYVQRRQLDEDAKDERRRIKDERNKIEARIEEIVDVLRHDAQREEDDQARLPFVAQEDVGGEPDDDDEEDEDLDVEVEDEEEDDEPEPGVESGHHYPKRGEIQ